MSEQQERESIEEFEAWSALDRYLRDTIGSGTINERIVAKIALRLLQAARIQQQPRWRPIETAPKDGTNVLLRNRRGNMATGLWMVGIIGTGWLLRGGNKPDAFFNGHHGPTHWMPLPPGPDPEESEGEDR